MNDMKVAFKYLQHTESKNNVVDDYLNLSNMNVNISTDQLFNRIKHYKAFKYSNELRNHLQSLEDNISQQVNDHLNELSMDDHKTLPNESVHDHIRYTTENIYNQIDQLHQELFILLKKIQALTDKKLQAELNKDKALTNKLTVELTQITNNRQVITDRIEVLQKS